MCESKERDWSRVTPISLIWVVSRTVMPEMFAEPSVERVFSRWLIPSRKGSDLDGLSASQLWENHACKSERQASRRRVLGAMVLAHMEIESWVSSANCCSRTPRASAIIIIIIIHIWWRAIWLRQVKCKERKGLGPGQTPGACQKLCQRGEQASPIFTDCHRLWNIWGNPIKCQTA